MAWTWLWNSHNTLGRDDTVLLRVDPHVTYEQLKGALKQTGIFKYAEPNFVVWTEQNFFQ